MSKFTKIILLQLLAYTLSCDAIGQVVDTLRLFHPNGHLRLEFPRCDGKNNGLARIWYPSDSLQITGYWNNGVQVGTFYHYHENGKIANISKYSQKGFLIKVTMYFPSGAIWSESTMDSLKTRTKEWHENGVLAKKVRTKGWSVSCIAEVLGSEKVDSIHYANCSYGYTPVSKNREGNWVNAKGEIVKTKMRGKAVEYYDNGKRKKKTIYGSNYQRVITYNENGKKVKIEVFP